MGYPKKRKLTLDINPPKIGTEYLKYGFDRIEELMMATNEKTKYMPRTILLEDLDQAVFDYINNTLNLVIDGTTVPLFFLQNDRWAELSRTWKFTDSDNNVPTPYITLRRTEKAIGTRLGTKYRIPQPKAFKYVNVPILDNGEIIYLQFRIPQPVNVDLSFELILFTKYRVDVNDYDEIILKQFASRQDYVFIKGNPMPLILEGLSESNTMENIDGDRFLMSKYNIKILGFIQDEKEFEIVKTVRMPRIGYTVS